MTELKSLQHISKSEVIGHCGGGEKNE